jgi:hypothetical protein
MQGLVHVQIPLVCVHWPAWRKFGLGAMLAAGFTTLTDETVDGTLTGVTVFATCAVVAAVAALVVDWATERAAARVLVAPEFRLPIARGRLSIDSEFSILLDVDDEAVDVGDKWELADTGAIDDHSNAALRGRANEATRATRRTWRAVKGAVAIRRTLVACCRIPFIGLHPCVVFMGSSLEIQKQGGPY